jgi:replicative DNA helicase
MNASPTNRRQRPARNGKPKPLGDIEAAGVVVRCARTQQPPPREEFARLPAEWAEAALLAEESGPNGLETWLAATRVRLRADAARFEHLREALDSAMAEPSVERDEVDQPPSPPPFITRIVGSAAFAAAKYERRFLVEQVLTAGEAAIVGGPKKALKTSTMVDLVLSIGMALDFLGRFRVPKPARVLLLSGESGDATLQETAVRVCKAKGVDLAEADGQVFWGFELPCLDNAGDLQALAEFIREKGIEVVVIDPLYLALVSAGASIDVANLFSVGPLLKLIASTCLGAGATPVLVHHLRKNREDAFAPPELEDLAFAGVQEFARQWIMLGRREKYEPGTGEHRLWLSVGGSAGHSGAWALDVSEGIVSDDFAGREWRVSVVNVQEARASAQEKERTGRAEQALERRRLDDERKVRELAEDAETALAKLRVMERATKNQLRQALKWSGDRIGSALYRLAEEGRVRPADIVIRCGKGQRSETGYEPSDVPPEGPLFHTRTHPDAPGQDPDDPGVTPTPNTPGQRWGSPPVGGSPPVRPGVEGGVEADEKAEETSSSSTHKSPGVDNGQKRGSA